MAHSSGIDWINSFWMAILITLIVGGPLSIWTAYITIRLTDFRNTIRSLREDLVAGLGIGAAPESFHLQLLQGRARLLSYYSILYEAGQFRAATHIVNVRGDVEPAMADFAKCMAMAKKNLISFAEVQKSLTALTMKTSKASISIGRLKPDIWAVLLGESIKHFVTFSRQNEKAPTVV